MSVKWHERGPSIDVDFLSDDWVDEENRIQVLGCHYRYNGVTEAFIFIGVESKTTWVIFLPRIFIILMFSSGSVVYKHPWSSWIQLLHFLLPHVG